MKYLVDQLHEQQGQAVKLGTAIVANLEGLARISHNQVENDVFHGMRGVRGMECRVASLKRLRRAGMRVFSLPFCGRDGGSLSIRARGGRHAPPPASCTRWHRAFTLVPGWPRSSGNPSSTGRRIRTPDGSAAWTPSRAPGSGTGTCAASMDGSGAAWRIPEGSRAGASSCNEGHGPVRSSGAGVR